MSSYGFGGSNKYSAQKTTVNGITFHSKGEANCYIYLNMLEKAGELEMLDLQPMVYLSRAKILYRPDFLIKEKGVKIWVDFKGFTTHGFAIKRKLWKTYGPGPLRIYAQAGSRIYQKEQIDSLDTTSDITR